MIETIGVNKTLNTKQLYKEPLFLNLDLDVNNKQSLLPLVNAFKKHSIHDIVCWDDEELKTEDGGEYIRGFNTDIDDEPQRDDTINKKTNIYLNEPQQKLIQFLNAIESLDGEALELWNTATVKTFDFGFQSGYVEAMNVISFELAPELLARCAAVGASLTTTIYSINQQDLIDMHKTHEEHMKDLDEEIKMAEEILAKDEEELSGLEEGESSD